MQPKKDKKTKETQLDFGLKNSPENTYYKYKGKYSLWLAGLDTKKLLKDPLVWLTIITSLSFIATQVYTIRETSQMPTRIPIFNYYIDFAPRLVESIWIYILPTIGLLTLIAGIIVSNSYYHKERVLTKTLLLVTLLTNLSICVIFFKLINTF